MEKRMTSGNSMKLLVGFMVPLIIGNIFQQMYSISDVIIVGRTIGVNALAAVGTAAPLFMLFVMMTMGLGNGFTVLAGQYFGAGNEEKLRHSVATSVLLSVLAVLVFDLIVYVTLDPALRWLNVPAELYEDCRAYTLIVAEGLWAMMAYNFLSALLRALGDSKTPVVFLILATIVNVLLALLFILVFHWGRSRLRLRPRPRPGLQFPVVLPLHPPAPAYPAPDARRLEMGSRFRPGPPAHRPSHGRPVFRHRAGHPAHPVGHEQLRR